MKDPYAIVEKMSAMTISSRVNSDSSSSRELKTINLESIFSIICTESCTASSMRINIVTISIGHCDHLIDRVTEINGHVY